MNRFNFLWALLLPVIALWIAPDVAMAVTHTTSGAHSVPIFHWGWLGAGLLPLGVLTLEDQMTDLKTTIKGWWDKGEEEQKKFGTMLSETKEKLEKLQTQADSIDKKLAERHAGSDAAKEQPLSEFLQKHEGLQKLMHDRSGNCVIQLEGKMAQKLMERKTTVTEAVVGFPTAGVMPSERLPGITMEPRQQLTLENVLASRPTTMSMVDWVKVNAPMVVASPQQGEGHTKLENAVTFLAVSEKVRTLTTWIPASKQILEDWDELESFLRTSLGYYVDLAIEQQLLTGNGSGENLNGLVTQATAFSTALLPAAGSYNRIDIIGRAIQQITTAKQIQPTFIVLNPVDWWAIRLTKDTQGRYILGDPMGPVNQQQLFGLTPIITTSIASGTFLVGSGLPAAAEIRNRVGMTIEIATQHEDYFARNLVAIRAERRLVLVVRTPGSFIYGSMAQSPA